MWIELPAIWIVVLNVLGIPVVHMLVAWWSTRLSLKRFRPSAPFYRLRKWEGGGRFYERVLLVRAWKDRLPDAGPWFSGFSKGGLKSRDRAYLEEFNQETCRGEFSHWMQTVVILVFLIWNPYPANLVIFCYAFLSNLPCIISQRHTRCRLEKVLGPN